MKERLNREQFLKLVQKSQANGQFIMDNWGLIGFYLLMGQPVYYLAKEEAYILANIEKEKLFIRQIISEHEVNVDDVICAFGEQIKEVRLGVTPYHTVGYNLEEFYEDNCHLFVLGNDLAQFENEKLMFPTLSHA